MKTDMREPDTASSASPQQGRGVDSSSAANDSTITRGRRHYSVLLRGVLPLVVIVAGAAGAYTLINTAPQAQRQPPQTVATLVAVRSVQPETTQVRISAMGTVIPAEQITLQPEVGGIIESVHPDLVPGGRIAADEVLATIDRADYQVALQQAAAQLARATAQLESARLEMDRITRLQEQQAVNKKELDDARTALAVAEADVDAAEAALEKARLDLERTSIRAPFACMVITENIDIGARVTTQTQLATLVGTSEYWVRAAIPVSQLRWLSIPGHAGKTGSPARIAQRLDAGVTHQWTGHVVRLLGDLEPQGRMARVLISVPQPLGDSNTDTARAPLLIGSYVDVTIDGQTLDNVYKVQRDELRGDNTVWIMTPEDRLDIRPVDIVYRGRDHVLVRAGLTPHERVVTSDIPAPVADMPLRLPDSANNQNASSVNAITNR